MFDAHATSSTMVYVGLRLSALADDSTTPVHRLADAVTAYVSAEVVQAAQAAIDAHSVGTPAGKCAACGEREPCRTREAAHATLAAFSILARRRPGHSGTHWHSNANPVLSEGVPQWP